MNDDIQFSPADNFIMRSMERTAFDVYQLNGEVAHLSLMVTVLVVLVAISLLISCLPYVVRWAREWLRAALGGDNG